MESDVNICFFHISLLASFLFLPDFLRFFIQFQFYGSSPNSRVRSCLRILVSSLFSLFFSFNFTSRFFSLLHHGFFFLHQDFLKWSFQLESVLQGYELFGHFDGSIVQPPKFAILDEEGVTSQVIAGYKEWLKTDKALLSLLIATLSDEALECHWDQDGSRCLAQFGGSLCLLSAMASSLKALDWCSTQNICGLLSFNYSTFKAFLADYISCLMRFVCEQTKYAKDLLHKAGMDSCRACSTPCKPHNQILQNSGSNTSTLPIIL